MSPIEEMFWSAWNRTIHSEYWELTPQYSIGKYRVDFANVMTRTAIELDGFASHSSTDDIARDRKRQREIEAMGWRVLRFGGKEIHKDAWKCADEVGQFLKHLPFSAWRTEERDIVKTKKQAISDAIDTIQDPFARRVARIIHEKVPGWTL